MSKIFHDQSEINVLFVHSLLDDSGISVYAFRVYCHIARRANRSGSAFPGMESIARVCKISESSAKRAVKELEERGLLEVRRSAGGSQSNTYILTSPSKWRTENSREPESNRTGFPQNPVPTEPAPGSHRPAKVIQEGNPIIPPTPRGAEKDESTSLKTKIRERVNVWFRRRPTTKWSDKEERALKKVCEVFEEEDLDLLNWYFMESGCNFLRRDPITLLNNWRGECDRARNYNP